MNIKMKEKIQIGIPCGLNSEEYTRHLIDSIDKTASGVYDIEYLIGINHIKAQISFLETLLNKNKPRFPYRIIASPNVFAKTSGTGWVSEGHGACLDMIMENMNSKYGMMVDADCAFLLKNWDQVLVSKITETNIIVGTEYGHDDYKYMKNANVITCFFDIEKVKSMKMSWKPELKHITIDESNTHVYHREIGETIFLDTGSELPKKLIENGFTSTYMILVSPRVKKYKDRLNFMTPDMRGEEYILDNKSIVSHVGRSSTRSFRHDPIIIKWKNRVSQWLSRGQV
tara:strand:- start:636 stop:1490 length:855 start_codon:yes stop_codon:yes gene_type:complete